MYVALELKNLKKTNNFSGGVIDLRFNDKPGEKYWPTSVKIS